MKYLYFFLIIIISFSNYLEAYAQQLPIFTQYRANRGYINPASIDIDAIKSDFNMVFGLSHRKQWTGLKSGPITQILHGSYRTTNNYSSNFLFGGQIINDVAGRVGFTGLFGRFAYIISGDPEESGLSLGLTFGGIQHRVDLTGVDNTGISIDQQGQKKLDAGAGIYYYTLTNSGDYFYAGLSVPQMLGSNLTYQTPNREFVVAPSRHFYGLVGYYIELDKDHHYLELSSWVKYVNANPIHLDCNIRYHIGEPLWVGVGMSTAKIGHAEFGLSLGENIGWNDGNIKIGYGHDFVPSTLTNYFKSTNEINITILLEK